MKLGADQMSASTPKSFLSRSAAAMTSRRIVPEPINCTFNSDLAPSLSRYMPFRMPFSAPAGMAGWL
ncbi:hypothetical protein D3C72_2578970 [compost metagenome]